MSATPTAAVHRKYDALFQELMHNMVAEINEAVKRENIRDVSITFDVSMMSRKAVGSRPVVTSLVLTDANLVFDIRYAGPLPRIGDS